MKNHLITAASIAAIALAAPAIASAQAVGHVDAAYFDSNDIDASGQTLSGAVAFPAGPVSFQLDAMGGHFRQKGGDSEKSLLLEGHAFYRTDAFAVGGVFSAFDEGTTAWGGEAQGYFGPFTASGSFMQLRDDTSDGPGAFATLASVQGKFFATDNISVAINYANVNPKGGADNTDLWGGEAEYKFGSAPLSLFASYQKIDANVPGSSGTEYWSIGGRLHFGAGTLKDQDRKGASMLGATAVQYLAF